MEGKKVYINYKMPINLLIELIYWHIVYIRKVLISPLQQTDKYAHEESWLVRCS